MASTNMTKTEAKQHNTNKGGARVGSGRPRGTSNSPRTVRVQVPEALVPAIDTLIAEYKKEYMAARKR